MRCPRRAVLLAIATGWLSSACLSPTLPLPPPGEPTVEQVGQDQYLLSGRVTGPGWVAAINDRTEAIEGQVTGREGRYSFMVVARRDDPMRLFYATGGELSSPKEFVIADLLGPDSEKRDGGSGSPDGGAGPADGGSDR